MKRNVFPKHERVEVRHNAQFFSTRARISLVARLRRRRGLAFSATAQAPTASLRSKSAKHMMMVASLAKWLPSRTRSRTVCVVIVLES